MTVTSEATWDAFCMYVGVGSVGIRVDALVVVEFAVVLVGEGLARLGRGKKPTTGACNPLIPYPKMVYTFLKKGVPSCQSASELGAPITGQARHIELPVIRAYIHSLGWSSITRPPSPNANVIVWRVSQGAAHWPGATCRDSGMCEKSSITSC